MAVWFDFCATMKGASSGGEDAPDWRVGFVVAVRHPGQLAALGKRREDTPARAIVVLWAVQPARNSYCPPTGVVCGMTQRVPVWVRW